MDENSQFRRALKSPLIVMGLCLIAGYAVYSNVMGSNIHTPPTPAPLQARPPTTVSSASSLPQRQLHEPVAVQWIPNPKRDPFAPYTVQGLPPSQRDKKTKSGVPSGPQNFEIRLILRAVAVEGDHRSAVINRSIVYEGEEVAGYEVLEIKPAGVWLNRKGKRQWLTFSGITTS